MQQFSRFQIPSKFAIRLLAIGLMAGLAGCACHVEPEPQASGYPIYPKTSLGLLDVLGFDVYVDQQAIHVLVAGTSAANNKQTQLRYLRSDDGGKHWSEPVPLNPQLPNATLAKAGNDVQLAVNGKQMLALWQTTGELPGMGPLVSAYSEDGGKTWRAGANPAVNMAGDQSHSDLAVDSLGVFHAVWLEDPEENGYQSLRYAKSSDLGQHWQASKTLDDSTCSCCWNVLKISPDGQLNVLYRDMKPRDMALIQSKDHGESWQKANRVGEFNWQFDGCPHIGGGLAYGQTGTVFDSVVWTGEEQKAGLYHLHSDDNGASWSKPYALGKNPLHSDIAIIADQRIIAVWDEREPEGLGVFSAQSADNGASWTVPKRLSQAGNSATHPRVVAVASGAIVMWTEKQAKQLSQWAFTWVE